MKLVKFKKPKLSLHTLKVGGAGAAAIASLTVMGVTTLYHHKNSVTAVPNSNNIHSSDTDQSPQNTNSKSKPKSKNASKSSKSTAPQTLSAAVFKTAKQVNNLLFFDSMGGPNRIVTNEYVYWSKTHCPYVSNNWEMTSGTLMIKNGAGYSGVPTRESHSICNSENNNNSSIFRLNTKNFTYGNVSVSMDYNIIKHGGGGAPTNVYDGLHMWVGYQNQYALYIATIQRWDGTLVIKKKVPAKVAGCSAPANDGCYYPITKYLIRPDLMKTSVWHQVSLYYNSSDSPPRMIMTIDGQKIFDIRDNDHHGKSYGKGAVGVRGDDTEFYFKNFKVTAN